MNVEILSGLTIPERELEFVASRGGGPGGQHVNKVSTRMTLRFDLEASPSLTADQKSRLIRRLSNRITRTGVLQMHCGRHRSQQANRQELIRRFVALLRQALRRRRSRRPTAPTSASRERRLTEKKQRARIKRTRGRHHPRDDD